MIVYHGSAEIIKSPDISHSYRPLDFGKGFYATTNHEQAVRWARRKAEINKGTTAIVNVYDMAEVTSEMRVKTFPEDLNEWIDFVCKCRDGIEVDRDYDLIIGKVADDRVFRVVDLYHTGIWDKDRAIKEIKAYPGYDQIAFVSQRAIDNLLTFMTAEEV